MNYKYESTDSVRIDVYLASVSDLSRSSIQKLSKENKICVNQKPVKSNYKLVHGDVISLDYLEPVASTIEAENIPIDIVYEDEYLLVVNKPKGMSVHPAVGTLNHTLVNALLYHCDFLSEIGGEERPGIVHRLDKNTSGLLVVAKNNEVHRLLQDAISKREVSRKYKALVWGEVDFEDAKIDLPLGRDPKDRKKQAVIDDENLTSRNAITHIKVLERYNHFTLLEAKLDTGRTHQIRVHLTYIGYPVVGDEEYKGIKKKIPFQLSKLKEIEFKKLMDECKGQLLHAYELSFVHPISGKELTFNAPLPENFKNMLEFIEQI